MKKQDENLLFVALREPSSIRRDVLVSTKDVLDVLRRYEEYRAISAEKQRALEELRQVVGSLQSLNKRLRSKMPKVAMKNGVSDRAVVSSSAVWEEEGKLSKGPSPEMARPKSKLDILQEELEKIELRLGALE